MQNRNLEAAVAALDADGKALIAAGAFIQAAKGYGRAVRRVDEEPLPGEPYMSIDDAAAIHANLIASLATEQPK